MSRWVPRFAIKPWLLSSFVGLGMVVASSVPAAAAPVPVSGAAPAVASASVSTSSLQIVGRTNLANLPSQPAAAPGVAPSGTRSVPLGTPPKTGRAPAGVSQQSTTALTSVTNTNVGGEFGFTGITAASEPALSPQIGVVSPPDQGLAVGPVNGAGTPAAVVEFVNAALAVYTPTGRALAPAIPANQVFGLPATAFLTDPRAYYDAATGHWFLTAFTFDVVTTAGTVQSMQYIAVSDSTAVLGRYTVFAINTTDASNTAGGCPCFGDFDQVGANANGFYIATNQYSVTGTSYNGAVIYALSKSQLVAAAESATASAPNVVTYQMSTNLDPFASYHLSPSTAVGSGGPPNVEYFVESNANATEANISGAVVGTGLEVFALLNTNVLNSNGVPTLVQTTVNSESYTEPPNAVQPAPGLPLQTDFNAVQEVTYAGGNLYAELSTSTGPNLSLSGVAWFAMRPSATRNSVSVKMAGQGYVGTAQNLLYPAIGVNGLGQGYLTMAISGPSQYPSAAYMTFSGVRGAIGPVHIAAAGAAPLVDFTCFQYDACRYGDYSMAQAFRGRVYMATEYVASPVGAPASNWATYVWSAPAP